jgi:SAM-dependent methyltransferase
MKAFDYILEQPLLFNLSQLPFTTQKFSKIREHNDLASVTEVLDVGCGPGTNAPRFAHAKYLGIDINERYIELAKRRYHRDFMVTDVTTSVPAGAYDFILLNSFLHHIDTPAAHRVLSRVSEFLTPDGHLHSVELVLPEKSGIPDWFARHDRGKFARPLFTWSEIFEAHLRTVIFEPFFIRHLGVNIMELVYFKGKIK